MRLIGAGGTIVGILEVIGRRGYVTMRMRTWCHIRVAWAMSAVAAVLVVAFASNAQGAHRYPVMGCTSLGTPVHEKVPVYKPYGRCSFLGGGVNDVGIYHVRWTGWGRKKASGRGSYYDGLGFLHHASMTVYRLRAKSYTRIRVKWDAKYAGGALRPRGNRVFNVGVNVVASAAADRIIECGSHVFGEPGWHRHVIGAGIWNLTTRRVSCSYARPFALHWNGERHYRGFTCRHKVLGIEYDDVRCVSGRRVIHWQFGA